NSAFKKSSHIFLALSKANIETKRHEIAVMIRDHHDTSDIVRILGVDRHTLYGP
ncbi:Hypothetical protein FKW44_003273, partial [Caligus rogercresseyi]